MTEFLYHSFIHLHNNGESQISFNRIKRLLSQNIDSYENNKANFNSLFQLLKIGLVDKSDNNAFSLSTSSIIRNKQKDIALGINLPHQIVEKNKDLIHESYLGLTIFKAQELDTLEYHIQNIEFNFDKSIAQLSPLDSIFSKWIPIVLNEIGQIVKIEVFNPSYNKWFEATIIDNKSFLYKVYIHNQFNYHYVFFYKGKYFKIDREDYDKVNTLKIIRANKAFFKYDKKNKLLSLKNYFTYPVYLYKLFFLNHIMNKGSFPNNNQFEIEWKHFEKITKKLNLNYTLE